MSETSVKATKLQKPAVVDITKEGREDFNRLKLAKLAVVNITIGGKQNFYQLKPFLVDINATVIDYFKQLTKTT